MRKFDVELPWRLLLQAERALGPRARSRNI
jgi:hypothetical protein